MSENEPRQRLRAATRAEHEALEALLPISRADVTAETYRDHLGFLLGFHEPVEAHLDGVAGLHQAVPDLAQRFKSEALRRDLGAWSDGPRSEAFPRPSSVAQALGVLYVFEGALLGARSLLPTLRRRGIVPGEIGSRYVEGYGAETAVKWSAFCDRLNGLEPAEADDAVAWATDTFRALAAWRRAWCRAVARGERTSAMPSTTR